MINIVLGMHRSGTSAIAGLLHTNGIVMGEDAFFSPRPSPENPKGYYEDVRFRKINDRLLKLHEYDVMSWEMPPPWFSCADLNVSGSIEVFVDACKLVQLVDNQHSDWGWKDPRTCLTWPFWAQVLDHVCLLGTARIIGARRNQMDIAKSMVARGNEGSAKYFYQLALEYERRVRLARPDMYVHFNDTPATIRYRFRDCLDISLPDLSFLDDSLRHRTSG